MGRTVTRVLAAAALHALPSLAAAGGVEPPVSLTPSPEETFIREYLAEKALMDGTAERLIHALRTERAAADARLKWVLDNWVPASTARSGR